MKRASSPLPFLLLAATAALVVIFYFQTRLMDLDRHNIATRNILHLKQLDTQLNEETLKAVSLQLVHYDTIVDTVSRMKGISETLHDPDIGLYGIVNAEVDKDLNTYRSLMVTKHDLVETVKSRTAIVRNTLNYLPLELARIAQDRHEPEVVHMHQLLSALLIHNTTPNENSRANLLQAIETLRRIELKPEDRAAIDQVLIHARANLKALDDISTDMRHFLRLPTIETLDRIFAAHTGFTVTRIKATNEFRIVLLILSLMLFAGLGFALTRLRMAHAEAERTSRQFRDAAESIGEGFAFFDAEGRLSFWNATFERLHHGVGDALNTGVTFDDFFKACVDSDVYQDFIFGDERPHDAISQALGHPYVVKSTHGVWMLASDSRMADGGTASVRVDITESKHAEEELRKLSRAVEQSPASVMITDTDGIITYVNPKFIQATGYSAAEAIGQKPSLISSGEKSAAEYAQLWQTISNGNEWRGEFHNKRKDGSLFWEYASISPIKNEHGDITYYLAVKEDITDRKRTMNELIEAKDQAETASIAKTQFLANMSHELRTPLNAIIGFSEMIKGQMFGPIGNDNYLEYSANILASGQHLLDVINDILDVSRIETGSMTIRDEDVDIAALCQEAVDMVIDQAQLAKLTMRSTIEESLPLIQGDGIRLKQIILNLLANAIKFTPAGGKIDLLAHHDEAEGAIVLVVRDTGYGIPDDQRDKILEPFEQVSDIYTRSHEGSGLGLFLVSSFVKLHEGSLTIDSEVDTGTTITVRLPVDRALAAQ